MAIKTSQLIQDDNLEALEDKLKKLAKTYQDEMDKMIKKAKEFEETMKNFNPAGGNEQRQGVKDMTVDIKKLYQEYEQLNAKNLDNVKRLKALKMAKQKVRREQKLEIKENAAAEGSYDQLSAKYAKMKMELNAMSKAQRLGTKEGRRMEKQAKKIYEEMDKFQKATGKSQLSVGRYGDAIKGLGGKMAGMLGIAGGVIGVVVGLFNAFKRSEKGAQFMTKVTGALNGTMSVLSDLTVDLSEYLVNAFNNPKQALQDFGKLLLDQVVNRVKASVELVGALGNVLLSALKLDKNGVNQALSDAGEALLKMGTGLDDEGIENFAEAIGNTAGKVEDLSNQFIKLEESRRDIRKENAGLITQIETLRQEEELLQAQSANTIRSEQERQDAIKESMKISEQRIGLEKQIAQNNLKLIDDEIAIRRKNGEDVLDLLEQRATAAAEVIRINGELAKTEEENSQKSLELEQENTEFRLDVIRDGFDRIKTINERRVADESKSFDERRAILEETNRLSDKAYNDQIKVIEDFIGQTIDGNDLVNTSDSEVLAQKIESFATTKEMEKQLFDAVRDRQQANQDLADSTKELNEAENDYNKTLADRGLRELETAQQAAILRMQREKKSEEDIERFKLLSDQKILQYKLDNLDKENEYQRILLEEQLAYTKDQLKELGEGKESKTIWDMAGIDLSPEGQKLLEKGLSTALSNIQNFTQKSVELANQRVQAAQNEVAEAQRNLQTEIQLRNQGFASNVDQARKDLELAKSKEEQALAQRRKAQQQQILLDTALQASNLITAVTEIWKSEIPFFLKLPAIATMFGSFVASKAKAFALTKEEFAEGGLEIIGGGRHGSGRDTLVGISGNRAQFAEQGEARMILSRRATAKYKKELQPLFESLSRGTFENDYLLRANSQIPVFSVTNKTDMRKAERELEAIRKQGEEQVYYLNGKKIIKRNNRLIRKNV